ncbi:hypothetical protein GCM10010430_28670 [Kitasatospora cystarginea]|uniref:Uncharacterized protein n=1 Tax=Kitasatospora cystarginea TaxID=58350 RepID=A0ABN3E041_9ACTN
MPADTALAWQPRHGHLLRSALTNRPRGDIGRDGGLTVINTRRPNNSALRDLAALLADPRDLLLEQAAEEFEKYTAPAPAPLVQKDGGNGGSCC